MSIGIKRVNCYLKFISSISQMSLKGNEHFFPFLSEKEQALEPMNDLDFSTEEKVKELLLIHI